MILHYHSSNTFDKQNKPPHNTHATISGSGRSLLTMASPEHQHQQEQQVHPNNNSKNNNSSISSNNFICSKCREYLYGITNGNDDDDDGDDNDNDSEGMRGDDDGHHHEDNICVVCCDLWNSEKTKLKLETVLRQACQPYGGISHNNFSQRPNQTTTVSLPGELFIQYMTFADNDDDNAGGHQPPPPPPSSSKPFEVWLQDLKRHLHHQIDTIVTSEQQHEHDNAWFEIDDEDNVDSRDEKAKSPPKSVEEEEEQGYLTIHLLCVPPKKKSTATITNHGDGDSSNLESEDRNRKKRKRDFRQHMKKGKGSNGGCDTQGGHPLSNLEMRLRTQQGYDWMTLSEAKKKKHQHALTTTATNSTTSSTPPTASTSAATPLEFHVAVHRRPIYLYGYYTKTRRDVSQSPFFVMTKKSKASSSETTMTATTTTTTTTKLGVTSVEEQICQPVIELLGISTTNNFVPDFSGGGDSSSSNGAVKYGMCKFHASGREDMDVRMLVRRQTQETSSKASSHFSTCRGRPFCIQIIDALNPIRSKSQLQSLIDTINHTSTSQDDDGRYTELNCTDTISYGKNPLGVGISPETFKMVSSSVFSGLQEDTESKVKHYGSLCWSERRLPMGDAGGKFGRNDDNNSNNQSDTNDLTSIIFPPDQVTFPLTIHQKTPLRVLHRRVNTTRERQVLCVKAVRVDDHHFRLQMSTQAGTYVKEFVHGDLGRTKPSVSSILGCKTTLLELDCEGIEFGAK